MFRQSDIHDFAARGLSEDDVQRQIEKFKKGVPFARLVAPCTRENGIRVLSETELQKSNEVFEEARRNSRAMKFVPASGAATRMFKDLQTFLVSKEEAPASPQVREFFDSLDRFAFAGELKKILPNGDQDKKTILKKLLTPEGLSYGKLPKALIPFHSYPDHPRTAIEEHLVEALHYIQDGQGKASLHFTLADKFQQGVLDFLKEVKGRYESGGAIFQISASTQKHSTDTVAVNLENQPFRLKNGKILFRPGGHGALLENLNSLQGDIVFIKNIDNVTTDKFKPTTYRYKKALGGWLVQIQNKIFDYLKKLEEMNPPLSLINEVRIFIREHLGHQELPKISDEAPGEQRTLLKKILHRPLRVCGMVQHRGEPGGGPYWVQLDEGSITQQIVESAQVDFNNSEQKAIFRRATHFNPVDLVCGLRDYQGQIFDLHQYRDEAAVFISNKTRHGQPLKALELPGLWNGGMAYWNTVFVEVPAETFAPVKTVNDLLRPEHQII